MTGFLIIKYESKPIIIEVRMSWNQLSAKCPSSHVSMYMEIFTDSKVLG
jgi:hypothetical protein